MLATERLQSDDHRIRLKWLMVMRVFLVTFLFGVTILISLRGRPMELTASFTALYLLIGYAYLLTAVSAFFLLRTRRLTGLTYLQIAGDIVFITGILQITGGTESPFVFLYFLAIISGSILRDRRGSFAAVFLSALSYLGLLMVHGGPAVFSGITRAVSDRQVELYYRTFLNLFSFFIVAVLSNQLALRLKRAGDALEHKEKTMKDLEALHGSIIQSVTSGLITTDLSGRVTSANTSAGKILQRPLPEVEGADLGALFPCPEVRRFLAAAMRNRKVEPCRFECAYASPLAEEMVLGMTLSALQDQQGEPTGILATFQDLTHIKALEQRMKENEQLAMIGELAAGIAHEIRNPLASMSGSIQILGSELALSGENRRLMEIILKETDRLNDLVGNFLLYARPRPLECAPARLGPLLEETLTLLEKSRRLSAGIRVERSLEEAVEILGDPTAMRQVLWNLALNAVEAMPEGGVLSFRSTRIPLEEGTGGRGFVKFTVSDTGKGIDPGIRGKLFFPFHTTKERGSGLGLAIVHQLVQQHGGWVDVESRPGRGTAFHLFFPEAVPVPVA